MTVLPRIHAWPVPAVVESYVADRQLNTVYGTHARCNQTGTVHTTRPTYADRSGMSICEEDK